MSHVSDSELPQHWARYLDQAVEGRAPILVARKSGKGNVVILSEEEFAGWQETNHLMSSPANAGRLLRSIRSADAGATEDHDRVVDPPAVQA